MIEKCIDDGVPDGTIIVAPPHISAAVNLMTDEIHEKLPSLDKSKIKKVLWQRLIDKGAVVAITNLGNEH